MSTYRFDDESPEVPPVWMSGTRAMILGIPRGMLASGVRRDALAVVSAMERDHFGVPEISVTPKRSLLMLWRLGRRELTVLVRGGEDFGALFDCPTGHVLTDPIRSDWRNAIRNAAGLLLGDPHAVFVEGAK